MMRRFFLALALASSLPLVARTNADEVDNATTTSKRVLLVGIDPSLVDYSKLPDLNATKLSAILEGQKDQLVELGYDAQWCFIGTGLAAEDKVVSALGGSEFTVVSIGAGVRLPPENMLLYERVVNAVHEHAPHARICFSQTANDTVQAVQRWI